jgi:glycosyltransferase involved in cell wall biosynthesis
MPVFPRVSVIIPVHNGESTIGRCLAALAQAPAGLAEVIVVDDRSTDRTASLAAAAGARVLPNPSGRGPAAARNAGAQIASGDVLVFIDADVEAQAQTLAQFVAHLDEHPEVAGAFGSYDDDPAHPNFASQYRNLLHHFIHQTAERRSTSFWAGCGAIRRQIFLTAGGFDAEKYPRPATEDIELGLRLARAGYVVHLLREIQVKHLKAWTALSMMRSDIFDRAVPWSQLILNAGSMPADLNLRWSHRFSAILSALLLASGLFLAFGHRRFYGVPAVAVAIGALVLLVIQLVPLDGRFYRFLLQRRGALFVLRVLPVHLLYYFYSGVTFCAVWVWHHAGRTTNFRRA